MIIIGIDPGTTGALAALDHHGQLLELLDLPVREITSGGFFRWRIDGAKLHTTLLRCVAPSEPAEIWIEDAQPVLHGGPGSAGTGAALVGAKHSILAILDCFPRWSVNVVTSSQWKRVLSLRKDKSIEDAKKRSEDLKRQCRERVLELYPKADVRLVKHHNRAEAVLIAWYGRQVWKGAADLVDAPRETTPAPRAQPTARVDEFADIPLG